MEDQLQGYTIDYERYKQVEGDASMVNYQDREAIQYVLAKPGEQKRSMNSDNESVS